MDERNKPMDECSRKREQAKARMRKYRIKRQLEAMLQNQQATDEIRKKQIDEEKAQRKKELCRERSRRYREKRRIDALKPESI